MTGKQKFFRFGAIVMVLAGVVQVARSLGVASLGTAAFQFLFGYSLYRLSKPAQQTPARPAGGSVAGVLDDGRIRMTEVDGVRRIEVKPMWATRIFAAVLLGFVAFGLVGMMRFPPPFTIPKILSMLFILGNCVLMAMFAFRTMLGGEIFEFRRDELYYRVGLAPYARVSIYKYKQMKNLGIAKVRPNWFEGSVAFDDQAEFGYRRAIGRHFSATQAAAMIQMIENYIEGANSGGEGKA